jgi:hypothetical protein
MDSSVSISVYGGIFTFLMMQMIYSMRRCSKMPTMPVSPLPPLSTGPCLELAKGRRETRDG